MIYTHYSGDKLTQLLDTTPQAIRASYNMKPTGLWISHDEEDGWLHWCGYENQGKGVHRYEVKLINKNLLWIKTNEDIVNFNNKYKTVSLVHTLEVYTIDWIEVFYKYNGIMIFPYRYEVRLELDFMWYYGWDCASGCIWRPSAEVKSIERAD